MNRKIIESLNQDPLFHTNRLIIRKWVNIEQNLDSHRILLENVLRIMTPNVTKDLPDGWQSISTIEKAEKWVAERKDDSHFYTIQLHEDNEIIGFLFLNIEDNTQEYIDLRIGYLLSESNWGKGIGSELISGLVVWGKNEKAISTISGGVEKTNIGSIKVLERNGFLKTKNELPENMLLYKLKLK